ncbi:MAG: helix-turn-helix transcriptional regulator [Bacteroidota bacterium]
MDNIGDNIRKIRILLDIKQAAMAQMLSISVNYYGKIERNEVELKPERLAQIANTLDVELMHIINFKQFLKTIRQQPESRC